MVYRSLGNRRCAEARILSLSNVRCYDIFGLNCIKTEFHQVQHLTVYPEKISMRPVASGNQKGRQNEGQQTLSKKGYDATEVFELREYQPGDSIRTIHWKLSEKFDTVLVREPSDTSSYDILVMFDAGLTSGEITYERMFYQEQSALQPQSVKN